MNSLCISCEKASKPNTIQNTTKLANSCVAKKTGPTTDTGPNHVANKLPLKLAIICNKMFINKHTLRCQSFHNCPSSIRAAGYANTAVAKTYEGKEKICLV